MVTTAPPITFEGKKEDEVLSVFLMDDLVKEYNYRLSESNRLYTNSKFPLTYNPPKFEEGGTVIRAMTKEEVEAMYRRESSEPMWDITKSVLNEQFTPKGLINNMPTIASTVTLAELVREIGWSGEIYYRESNKKIYVILKGYAGERMKLTGTRYLNTHSEVVRLGIAKVDIKSSFKSGFKMGIYVYGAVKTYEAVDMIMKDGKLKPSFWMEMGPEVTKLAITSLITAAAGTAVVAAGIPIAVGIGITLVVGFAAGVLLDALDKKIGFTETFKNAAEKLWENLKSRWNSPDNLKNINPTGAGCYMGDPLAGFMFFGSLRMHQKTVLCDRHTIYTV